MTRTGRRWNAERLHSEFDREGFVVLPDCLDDATLVDIAEEIDRHFAPLLGRPEMIHTNAREGFQQFECEVMSWGPCEEGNASFIALRDDPALAAVTEECVGAGYQGQGSMVMVSIGKGKGQAWHQDCPPDATTQYNVNRLLYTQDVTRENGAIVIVPGSHRLGRIPAGGNQEAIEGEVVLTPTAGTLVLLHGHVYHRVTPNLTNEPRVSVNFRVYPCGSATDVNRVGVYRNGSYDFRAGRVVA